MIYIGIKVKLKNEDSVYGSLLRFYQDKGYLYVSRIFENNDIWLSDTPHGGINISLNNIDVLKGNKKLTEMVRRVSLTFPLIKEEKSDSNWYRCREHMKLTVE